LIKSRHNLAMSQGEYPPEIARAARLLGVDDWQDPQALKTAFRTAVKRVHPDRPGGDAGRLRAVIEAYDLLKAPAPARSPRPAPRQSGRPAAKAVLEITPTEAMCGGRHPIRTKDGRDLFIRLPPGLRAGDQVRVAGELCRVSVASLDGLSVLGDHLCVSATASAMILRYGGAITVSTPLGPRAVRISRQDGERGLVRVAGRGLPPRGEHPRGDLLVRLFAAPQGAPAETMTQDKLRRFVADWAA